jgi:hypothetical protein
MTVRGIRWMKITPLLRSPHELFKRPSYLWGEFVGCVGTAHCLVQNLSSLCKLPTPCWVEAVFNINALAGSSGGWKTVLSESKNVKLSLCFFLTEHHAMKAYWGSAGIAPHILDLCTRWRSVVCFTHRPLYPQGKSPWCSLNRTPDSVWTRW